MLWTRTRISGRFYTLEQPTYGIRDIVLLGFKCPTAINHHPQRIYTPTSHLEYMFPEYYVHTHAHNNRSIDCEGSCTVAFQYEPCDDHVILIRSLWFELGNQNPLTIMIILDQ